MSITETQYFALLRAALWGDAAELDSVIDWEAVLKISEHQGNTALLADVAVRMTGTNKPSEALCGSLRSVMRSNLVQQMHLKQILVSAVKLLREHDIEPVLLKGFGLASLYPNPALRQFGDIDLFVGLDNFHPACSVLRTMPGGYNWGEEVDSGRHFNIEFGPYPMEVHRVSADVTDPKENKVYADIERDGLFENAQRIDLDGFEISIPSKEFQVFFTFYHAWHHFLTTGVGWRQLSDVALTLHAYHGCLDDGRLRQWLSSMHLMKPWQTFGYLLVERLGLPMEEMPFYDAGCRRKAQRLYRNVMEMGNFKRVSRFKMRTPKRRFWHKIHSFFSVFVDFFYRARVFPSLAFREMRTSLGVGLRKMGRR